MKQNKTGLIKDKMSDKIVETARELAGIEGPKNITVKRILQELGISNRVFYNRFKNIDEVMTLVYKDIVASLHNTLDLNYSNGEDFFEDLINLMADTLVQSYSRKEELNQYIFEQDSICNENFNRWMKKIKTIIEYAIDQKFMKPLNIDQLSYAVWCFTRGFNADALSRNIPLDEAIETFKYSLNLIVDGIKYR